MAWPIVTYGSEAWTLNKELEGNIGAFEMQCYWRCMRISYTEHVTNDEVLQRVGQGRALMDHVKSRKLKYFGHVWRHHNLEKDIMLGIMPGTRRQGGQKRQWIDNVAQWTGKGLVDIVRLAENRDMCRRFVYGVAYARLPGTARTNHAGFGGNSLKDLDRGFLSLEAGCRISDDF